MSIRHDWYQAGEEVTITVYIKNAVKKNCNIYVKRQQVKVETCIYKLGIKLFAPIIIEKSYCSVYPTKVEIKLAKVNSEHWVTLHDEWETGTFNVLSFPNYEEDWVKLSNKSKVSLEGSNMNLMQNLHGNLFSFFWHAITGWIIYLVGVNNGGN